MTERKEATHPAGYLWRLHRNVLIYIAILITLFGAMAWAEQWGLSRNLIGPIFLFTTVMIYAFIGISGRTSDEDEYYVAGRRIPAMYNGMATAADWMSAATFISLAGALYLQGFSGNGQQPGGLAYVMGWTGGFCLVGLLIAPYLRSMNLYTLPDYFDQRFGGRWPRIIAALASVLCSFTYVVAQIYGIGLIASRLTGVQFEIGILLGLVVFLFGGHACHHLDPSGAVHHVVDGLLDPSVLAGIQTIGHANGPFCVRPTNVTNCGD